MTKQSETILWKHEKEPASETWASWNVSPLWLRLICAGIFAYLAWNTFTSPDFSIKNYMPTFLIGLLIGIMFLWLDKSATAMRLKQKLDSHVRANIWLTDAGVVAFNHDEAESHRRLAWSEISTFETDFKNGSPALRIEPKGKDSPVFILISSDMSAALDIAARKLS